jgi:hypothetical protein
MLPNVRLYRSHLDLFAAVLDDVIEEHAGKFHLSISATRKGYERKWSPALLAEYRCQPKGKLQEHTR